MLFCGIWKKRPFGPRDIRSSCRNKKTQTSFSNEDNLQFLPTNKIHTFLIQQIIMSLLIIKNSNKMSTLLDWFFESKASSALKHLLTYVISRLTFISVYTNFTFQFFSGLISTVSAAGQCEDGWLPYGSNCYKFANDKFVRQPYALQECTSQGASLLRLGSADEIVSMSFPHRTLRRTQN